MILPCLLDEKFNFVFRLLFFPILFINLRVPGLDPANTSEWLSIINRDKTQNFNNENLTDQYQKNLP
jgi:hypothetical protein